MATSSITKFIHIYNKEDAERLVLLLEKFEQEDTRPQKANEFSWSSIPQLFKC